MRTRISRGGHTAVEIGKKAFVFIASGRGETTSLRAKLPQSAGTLLKHAFAMPTEYGLGKHSRVRFAFARGAQLPIALLREGITESFRAIAPKTVVKEFDRLTRDRRAS